MRVFRLSSIVLLLAFCGCDSEAPMPEAPEAPAEEGEAPEVPAEEAAEEPAAAEEAEVEADTFDNGTYRSPAFNVQFTLPEGWRRADEGQTGPAGLSTSEDSISFVWAAPAGQEDPSLRLVVANSDSIQLVDQSFSNLTETIGFDNVRIVPDASQARTFNGVPGYRTEADALLRGEAVPVYLIAQALELPGKPTMFTIFVDGDHYFEHSDDMKAILDSIEVLNLRAE